MNLNSSFANGAVPFACNKFFIFIFLSCRTAGAKVMLLSKERLKETFPWMNVDGIELGCYGLEHEGWFDPMSLVNAFKVGNLLLEGLLVCLPIFMLSRLYAFV